MAEAYNNRGNVLSNLGQYEEAVADYDKAIYLKPDLADAFIKPRQCEGRPSSISGCHHRPR